MFESRGASPNRRREGGGTGMGCEAESPGAVPIRVSGACRDPDHDPSLDHAQATNDDPDHDPNRGHDHGRKRIAEGGQARQLPPLLSRWCCLAPSAKRHAIRRGTQYRQLILVGADCAMRVLTDRDQRLAVDRHGVVAGEKEGVDRDH